MVMKKPKSKIRFTIDMDPEFYERFEALEKAIGAPTKARVVRNALRVYEYIAQHQIRGSTFEVHTRSGEVEHPKFPDLPWD